MRNTHTSEQTSKCSTHIIRRIFQPPSSINKILLDAQIIEYKKNYQPQQMHMIIHKTTKIQHLLLHNYTLYIITIRYLYYHETTGI